MGGLGGDDLAAPSPPPSSSASLSPERLPAKPCGRKDDGGGASHRPCVRAARGAAHGGGGVRQIRAASAGSGGVAAGGGDSNGNGHGDGDNEGRGELRQAVVAEGDGDGNDDRVWSSGAKAAAVESATSGITGFASAAARSEARRGGGGSRRRGCRGSVRMAAGMHPCRRQREQRRQ